MEQENKTLDGNMVVSKSEAKKLLKEYNNKVSNGEVSSFVSLKDINKIYPNGVQAVYDFNIDINEHDFIVLVGPSGCGKSTTLRMVAGLEQITSGYLYIDKVLSNYLPSKDRDISMVFQSYALYPSMTVYDNIAFPLKVRKYRKVKKAETAAAVDEALSLLDRAEELVEAVTESKQKAYRFSTAVEYVAVKCGVSDLAAHLLLKYDLVSLDAIASNKEKIVAELKKAKDADLAKIEASGMHVNEKYECLDAENNPVVYLAKLTKSEIREKVYDAARILDLGPYLDRKPNELSGGQMQRVALGRAIVRNAKLFLMDEPLSNLDAKLRVQMRSEIVRIHEAIGATSIYVTHDQTEAMTMATKIAVMSKGWVQQIGTPQDIYNNPKNIFVATFIGAPAMNIIKGNYCNGKVNFASGFSLDLGEDFAKKHDAFYEEKIADCKRMLNHNDFKKMHGVSLVDTALKAKTFTCEELSAIKDFASTISDENGEAVVNVLSALLENGSVTPKAAIKALGEARKQFLMLKDIPSSDIALLHNAQVFNKDDKKKDDDMMFYNRKHHRNKKAKKVTFKVNNLVFANNLYDVAVDLLASYEACLNSSHEINVGIRPENIHLANEFVGGKKSPIFQVHSDVVELMGSELLIHSNWNDVDLISKISTGTLVKTHTDVDLVLDMDKVLLFDKASGSTIK